MYGVFATYFCIQNWSQLPLIAWSGGGEQGKVSKRGIGSKNVGVAVGNVAVARERNFRTVRKTRARNILIDIKKCFRAVLDPPILITDFMLQVYTGTTRTPLSQNIGPAECAERLNKGVMI